jgi:uncharacterized protein YidB (DUF937 family)
METKKLIGAAAFSLALAGGGVAGALLGSPGSSGAQTSTTSTTAPAATPGTPGDHHFRFGRGPGLAAVASAIGISEDDLRTELEAGKTIAEVAQAHGVDVDTVIDAMVTEVTADAREHITALVNGQLPAMGDHHGPRGVIRAELSKVAETIGVTTDELKTALQGGQSIADVAEANGVDVQKVIDTLVADATARIDAKVASGDLTAERAATMKENLTERITALVNHAGGFGGRHRGPRP